MSIHFKIMVCLFWYSAKFCSLTFSKYHQGLSTEVLMKEIIKSNYIADAESLSKINLSPCSSHIISSPRSSSPMKSYFNFYKIELGREQLFYVCVNYIKWRNSCFYAQQPETGLSCIKNTLISLLKCKSWRTCFFARWSLWWLFARIWLALILESRFTLSLLVSWELWFTVFASRSRPLCSQSASAGK